MAGSICGMGRKTLASYVADWPTVAVDAHFSRLHNRAQFTEKASDWVEEKLLKVFRLGNLKSTATMVDPARTGVIL